MSCPEPVNHADERERLDDFDLRDVAFRSDPSPRWRAMREHCPVAHTTRNGGGWMLSRHADITAVALDPATFSSRAGEVTGPVPAAGRELKLPPVTTDPPSHARQRKLLMPFFSRQAVDDLEPVTRRTASSLVQQILAAGELVEAVDAFARIIPVVVTTEMLGLPEEDQAQFREWTLRMLKDGAEDYAVRADAVREIRGYFAERLERGPEPGSRGILGFSPAT